MSQPVDELINEARVFYHSLVQVSEHLHGPESISLGMRAVLEFLELNGPETVPNMARNRRVTRQRIQTLTNTLLSQNLVQSIDNPATKRSPLIKLTPGGKKLIRSMRKKESSILKSISVSDEALRDAKNVLQAVRLSLEAADIK